MTAHFLRRVLAADAIVSGAAGALLLFGAGAVGTLTDLQPDILFAGGIVLVPFVALVTWLALQHTPPRAAVWAVIAMNALWVAASAGLLLSGIERPNMLGYGFVIAQAVAVGVFAELQYIGLKRMAARAAA